MECAEHTVHCGDSTKVPRSLGGDGRAQSATMGGRGSARVGGGWGGVTAVARATGLSRTTISAGLAELALPAKQRSIEGTRVRRPGGGRKALTETDRGLLGALEALIEPVRRGDPEEVRVHDFLDKNLGKAIPYGVYDMINNQGWVSVGIDHDTAQFAVNSIRRWWKRMGRRRFPRATELLITADGGGSNSSRSRLWKVSLQALADQLGLCLHVCHFPPGTSKWNKIEHRLFSFITQNWRGRPLLSHQTVVNLIAGTTTQTGLIVKAALDTDQYETAVKVTEEQLSRLRLTPHRFHGDWNYQLTPHKRK